MNKTERFLAALRCEVPDRVPMFDFLFQRPLYTALIGHAPEIYNGPDAVRCALALAQTRIASIHPLQRTAGMDLQTIKEQYGNRFCLVGNIDSSRTLPYGSPDEVAAEVCAAIDVAAPGGGYILASDHSLHDGISVENITTLFRVGAEYGNQFYSR